MTDKRISDLTAASSVADANEFEINEAGTSKKVTATQIKTHGLTGGASVRNKITAETSAGLLLEANNGTDVALLGAGGGTGATFYGTVNMGAVGTLTDAATSRTNLEAVGTVTTGVTGADKVNNVISLTQSEYDAIATPLSDVLYLITDADPSLASVVRGTFTPSWTATTTNPVIGNGTIDGTIIKIDQLVKCKIKITMGSTTTYGSGDFVIGGLPYAALDSAELEMHPVLGIDSGVGYAIGHTLSNGTSSFRVWNAAISDLWDSAVPHTWATGDVILINLTYRAAS